MKAPPLIARWPDGYTQPVSTGDNGRFIAVAFTHAPDTTIKLVRELLDGHAVESMSDPGVMLEVERR